MRSQERRRGHSGVLGFAKALLTLSTVVSLCFGHVVAQPCSPRVFPADTVYLDYVPGALTYCLADGADLSAFDLTLDGVSVEQGTEPSCGTYAGAGATLYYDFSGVPGGGLGGGVYLSRWRAGEVLLGRRSFADAAALADQLLRWDPGAGWRYDRASARVVSDLTAGDYSALEIRWEATGVEYELPLGPVEAPGAAVTLPTPGATYLAVATARDGSCEERLAIVRRRAPRAPTTERFTVIRDGDSGRRCVSTDRSFVDPETSICRAPDNGVLQLQGVGCFTYSPATGFTGADGACIVTCGAGACDTTFLEFAVVPPPCGTFVIEDATRLEAPSCTAAATLRLRRTDDGTDAPAFTLDGEPAAATLVGGVYALELTVGTWVVTASSGGDACGQSFSVEVVCDATEEPCVSPFDVSLVGQGVDCSGGVDEIFLPAPPAALAEYAIAIGGVSYTGPRTARTDPRGGSPATVIEVPGPRAVFRTVELRRDAECVHVLRVETRCVTPAFDTLALTVGVPAGYCLPRGRVERALGEPTVVALDDPGLANVIPRDGGCVTVTADVSGATDVLLVACTEIGICDTAYLHLLAQTADTIVPRPREPPIAVDDQLVVGVGGRVTADLLANDDTGGEATTVELLSGFRYGLGEVVPGGLLDYESGGEMCGVTDTATYSLCGALACDTATIAVRLRCDTVIAFSGFSPNGDGINDVFTVEGLEDHPGGRLLVFNRYGRTVYEAIDYRSDWDGRAGERDLPDGVYFYFLDLPGRGEPIVGTVMLFR